MSVMWADDFGGYGHDKALMLDGLYAEQGQGTGLVDDPDPNADGSIVYQTFVNAVQGTRLRRVFPNSRTTAGLAFRLWLEELPSTAGGTPAFSFANGANQAKVSVDITTTGAMGIKLGEANGSATVATTAGPVLTPNAWNHIEIKAVASEAAGTVEVRVNGTPVVTVMDVNTGTEFSQVRFLNESSQAHQYAWYIKDLVAWDGTGTNNNNFLGSVSVIGRTPNSDVAFPWTPSTGATGFNLLDNSPPLDDTQFISAGLPLPAACQFGLSPLPDDITVVKALISQIRVRKSDGGEGNVQVGIISNGVTDEGADRSVTTAFTYYEDVCDKNPDGNVNWTPGTADAATLKINRTV